MAEKMLNAVIIVRRDWMEMSARSSRGEKSMYYCRELRFEV